MLSVPHTHSFSQVKMTINVSCGRVMPGGNQWKIIAYMYCGMIKEGGEIIYGFRLEVVVVVVTGLADKALPSIRL